MAIGSKLHAYFPDPQKDDMQIHRKWKRFSERLTRYYERLAIEDSKIMEEELNGHREELFHEKASEIEDILCTKVTGFGFK